MLRQHHAMNAQAATPNPSDDAIKQPSSRFLRRATTTDLKPHPPLESRRARRHKPQPSRARLGRMDFKKGQIMGRFRYFTDDHQCVEVFEGPHADSPLALVLLGMPATIGESELSNFLNELGFTVLQPHYSGTYDSDGQFTPKTAISSIISCLGSIQLGEVLDVKSGQNRKIPRKITCLIGYSFGAHIAFHVIPEVTPKTLLLISPAISYGSDDTGFKSEGVSFYGYMQKSRPKTYRMGPISDWHSLFSAQLNTFPKATNLSLKIVTVVGAGDPSIDRVKLEQGLRNLTEYNLPGSSTLETIVAPQGAHSIRSILADDHVRRQIGDLLEKD